MQKAEKEHTAVTAGGGGWGRHQPRHAPQEVLRVKDVRRLPSQGLFFNTGWEEWVSPTQGVHPRGGGVSGDPLFWGQSCAKKTALRGEKKKAKMAKLPSPAGHPQSAWGILPEEGNPHTVSPFLPRRGPGIIKKRIPAPGLLDHRHS